MKNMKDTILVLGDKGTMLLIGENGDKLAIIPTKDSHAFDYLPINDVVTIFAAKGIVMVCKFDDKNVLSPITTL
jgi:hypothetical protein